MVVLSGALATYGIPLEAIGLILGVDAVMDMARTAVNILGNCLGTCVMAMWEGEFRNEEWQREQLLQQQQLASTTAEEGVLELGSFDVGRNSKPQWLRAEAADVSHTSI